MQAGHRDTNATLHSRSLCSLRRLQPALQLTAQECDWRDRHHLAWGDWNRERAGSVEIFVQIHHPRSFIRAAESYGR